MPPELTKQIAELRAMARRARRLAATVRVEDGRAIVAYAKELETQAAQLEALLGDAGASEAVVHEQQQAQQQAQVPETKPKT